MFIERQAESISHTRCAHCAMSRAKLSISLTPLLQTTRLKGYQKADYSTNQDPENNTTRELSIVRKFSGVDTDPRSRTILFEPFFLAQLHCLPVNP